MASLAYGNESGSRPRKLASHVVTITHVRPGKEIPHSFAITRRSDISPGVNRVPQASVRFQRGLIP